MILFNPNILPLLKIFDSHPNQEYFLHARVGRKIITLGAINKVLLVIHNNALMLRRQFLETIMQRENANFMNFIFDGQIFVVIFPKVS